jgi:hypothetical protein
MGIRTGRLAMDKCRDRESYVNANQLQLKRRQRK